MAGGFEKDTYKIGDMELPFKRLSVFSVPGKDIRFKKDFRFELLPGVTGTLYIGIRDKAFTDRTLIVETVDISPEDERAYEDLVVTSFMDTKGDPVPYNPEKRAQPLRDLATVMTGDFMVPEEFPSLPDQVWQLRFTNGGAFPIALSGQVKGRILRKD